MAKVLKRIDQTRLDVAHTLDVRSVSAREQLYLRYDSPGSDLRKAIHHTEAYRGILAPTTIVQRYMWEDVPIVSSRAELGDAAKLVPQISGPFDASTSAFAHPCLRIASESSVREGC